MSTARLAPWESRRLSDALQVLRDHGLWPGTAVPSASIDLLEEWVASHTREARLFPLPVGPPAPTGVARTPGPAHDVFLADRLVPPRQGWALSLSGGRLATDGGLAIANDGRVLSQTAWDLEQLALLLPSGRRLPRPLKLGGTHASLISQWSGNFFHWMLEALPRFAVVERLDLAVDAFIVPEHLSRFQAESLDLLGVTAVRRTPFRRSHVRAENLIVSSSGAHTGNPSPWLVQWLREHLGPPPVDAPSRRLYVSRADASLRRIANEHALRRLLERRGFEVVTPATLSLSEQIRTFSEARFVLGAHGAAHTNALFSSRVTLIELFPADYLNACNFALAQAAGHEYWYLVGEPARGSEFEVPLDLVEAVVDQVVT